jgi:hypothetical protein
MEDALEGEADRLPREIRLDGHQREHRRGKIVLKIK